MLLEKLMEKDAQATGEKSTQTAAYDSNQPQILPRFHARAADQSMLTPQSLSVSNEGTIEMLRKRLAAMLPCQEDVDHLSDLSHRWLLIRRHILPHELAVPLHDLWRPFNVFTVSQSHPMIIARLLLCIAICIQQLPPNVDLARFQTIIPLREMMENIMTEIAKTVTSDDELTGSMEGIECLLLLGMYQHLAGSLRRAWLTFRRAVSVAQLLGFHKVSPKNSQEAVPGLLEIRRHYIWYQIMLGVMEITQNFSHRTQTLKLLVGTLPLSHAGCTLCHGLGSSPFRRTRLLVLRRGTVPQATLPHLGPHPSPQPGRRHALLRRHARDRRGARAARQDNVACVVGNAHASHRRPQPGVGLGV
jgi:hypothetical protein